MKNKIIICIYNKEPKTAVYSQKLDEKNISVMSEYRLHMWVKKLGVQKHPLAAVCFYGCFNILFCCSFVVFLVLFLILNFSSSAFEMENASLSKQNEWKFRWKYQGHFCFWKYLCTFFATEVPRKTIAQIN